MAHVFFAQTPINDDFFSHRGMDDRVLRYHSSCGSTVFKKYASGSGGAKSQRSGCKYKLRIRGPGPGQSVFPVSRGSVFQGFF